MASALAVLAFIVLAGAAPVSAQPAYPSKPVRVIVAFTAGGTSDLLARAVSQKISEALKQPFVIENKPGAGGNIGTEFVIRSPPDGYTLTFTSVGPMAVNQTLYSNLAFDPLVDLVPIVQLADVPNVLVVNPEVPAKTIEEFVAYVKANPNKLSYGTTGIGTSSHLTSIMFNKRLDSSTLHVPYKGGSSALPDLLGGRTQFMFATIPSVINQIKTGKLRALGVSSLKRSRSLPDVPTLDERGFAGFSSVSWFGFFAPKGTPAPVIALLNKTVNESLPLLEAQMIREGADPVGGTPAQFGKFTRDEYEKWKLIVQASGAKAE